MWCPSFTFAVRCSKYYFTKSIHHCYYLESAPQAEPPRVQGLLKIHHRDLWQAQLSSFYYKKISIYFKDILGEARREGKKKSHSHVLSPMGKQILLQPSHVHLAHKFTTTQLLQSQGVSSVPAHLGKVTQGTDLALLPVLHTTLILNHLHPSQRVCRPKVELAKRDRRSDKLPGVCSHAHSLVLPLPFHLPPDLSSLNFGQILSPISRKERGFFTVLPAAPSL